MQSFNSSDVAGTADLPAKAPAWTMVLPQGWAFYLLICVVLPQRYNV
jgi:hypothetical protein